MSHFTCMVYGDDVTQQLAPFHEFETTGRDDEWVVEVDVTEEKKKEWQEYHPEQSFLVYLQDCGTWFVDQGFSRDTDDEHVLKNTKWRYAVQEDGQIVKVVKRTNPNAKWDWWVPGGRWKDKLILKDGSRGHSEIKSKIEWKAMEEEHLERELGIYDRVHRALADTGWPEPWEEAVERLGVERARQERQEHPGTKALASELGDLFTPWFELSHYRETRGFFEHRERLGSVATFAFIHEGLWHAKADMGWWGITHNKRGLISYYQNYRFVLDELPDDTLCTVVDCHI